LAFRLIRLYRHLRYGTGIGEFLRRWQAERTRSDWSEVDSLIENDFSRAEPG
jgi:hypothetical protein